MMVKKPIGEKAEQPNLAEELQDEHLEQVEAEIVPVVGEKDQLQALQDELADTRLKAEEYLDGWQRARAELANYRKRVEREQAMANQMAAGSIIRRYLDVMDDLDRALKNRPSEGDGAAWAQGIDLIYRKLNTIIDNEGVIAIQAEGQSFDPNFHEAISLEESSSHESGQVIEVLKRGYLLGDRVLRPAQVRVAR